METQLGTYSLSSDNKGILSLLSAIEQSEDIDPDVSPSKIVDKDPLSVVNFPQLQSHLNLDSLDMSGDLALSNFSSCLICGRTPGIDNQNDSMVDIFSEISIPGEKGSTSIHTVIEDIIPIRVDSTRPQAFSCVECFAVVDAIAKLRVQINEYISVIKTRYEESCRTKSTFPSVSDYTSVLELKMPLNIFNVRDEEGLTMSPVKEFQKKSKLQILAETLEGEHLPKDVQISDESDGNLTLNKENKMLCNPTCDKCGIEFDAGPRRNKTVKTRCSPCSKVGRSKKVSKTQDCAFCSKSFKSKSSLNEHIQLKHFGNSKVYPCSNCQEKFSSKHARIIHERIHKNGTKDLICDECGDSFLTYQSLQFHRSKHTGDFSYNCSSCGKGFNNFKLLEEHSHIHTGQKPYACAECNKSFANRGSLWLHKKKHDVVKPYMCDYCNKVFGHSSHLVVHKRMHTGETPYKCRFCAEGFISGNHLKRHMRIHQNELPYACGICKQEFGKRSDFVKHGNTVHNGNIIDDIRTKENTAIENRSATPEEENTVDKYTTILVEDNERILLSNGSEELLNAPSGGYTNFSQSIQVSKYLPVTLLDGLEEENGKEESDQTIVFIEMPQSNYMEVEVEEEGEDSTET